MSTIIEDPGIPLVGRNGGFAMYTQDTTGLIRAGEKGRPRKYDNVGYRLAKRKELFQRRKIICDFALSFALLGIILMIVETELYMARVYTKSDTPSLLIKSCISISTVTLLGFVLWYHMLDIKLYMCDNSLEDWRLALSWKRMVRIGIELAVYAIHPIPGNYEFAWTTFNNTTHAETTVSVPIDVVFSIPMFLRYLVQSLTLIFTNRA